MNLRQFNKLDANRCSEIILSNISLITGVNEQGRQFLNSINTPEYLKNKLPKVFTLVYKKGQRILGLGTLEKNSIKRVYVDPKHHRQGIGTTIVKGLEKQANKQNLQALTLNSTLNANEFYQFLGYKPQKENISTKGKAKFIQTQMTKKL